MPSDPEVDEDYASSEDSDFAPDDAPDRASSPDSDGDDAEAGKPAGAKRKRAGEAADAEDLGYENSGDEAIIEKGKKRRKKKAGDDVGGDDEDGGEGSLIKTRSQRAQEKVERKAAVAQGPVTIDVDAVWSQMMAGASASSKSAEDEPTNNEDEQSKANKDGDGAPQINEPSELIKIKRTYNFAGKVHTEEKMVARDSAEAKLYLASLGDQAEANDEDDSTPKRMPRKAFRSAFEPVIDQLQRADLNLGMSVRLQARELAKANAKKLSTVEKSRMDWAGYVDKEGLKDELELAGKSKGSFVERQTFLARSEAIREEESRRARAAARA